MRPGTVEDVSPGPRNTTGSVRAAGMRDSFGLLGMPASAGAGARRRDEVTPFPATLGIKRRKKDLREGSWEQWIYFKGPWGAAASAGVGAAGMRITPFPARSGVRHWSQGCNERLKISAVRWGVVSLRRPGSLRTALGCGSPLRGHGRCAAVGARMGWRPSLWFFHTWAKCQARLDS